MVLVDENQLNYEKALGSFTVKSRKDIKTFMTMIKHVRLILDVFDI